MAMNFGQIALAVAGGAAKQFVKTQEELREEYKEKKERQQQWADRYGRRTLDELQSRADVVLNAGEALENAGMTSANLTQMVNKYDAGSILELAKRVEKLNPSELAALKTSGQLNEVLKFKDTHAKSAEDWADVAVKSFTIPQIEPEPTPTELARTGGQRAGLLAGLRDRMGPRQEREYQDWYNSTYITGPDGEEYSIRELRAAPTGIMDRGKVPDFDLSMFEKDATQTEWNRAENDIFNIAYSSVLASDDRELINLLSIDPDAEGSSDKRSIESREALIKTDPRLKTYFEDAVRRVYEERADAFNTSGGRLFFDDPSKLDTIINPITLEEELEKRNLTRDEVKEFKTVKEAVKYWNKNPDVNFAIVDGEFAERDDPIESRKVEKTVDSDASFNSENFKLLKQPEEIIIEPRPSAGRAKIKQRKTWDAENGKYYNPNGSYLVVSPRPDQTESTGFGRGANRETSHEKWNRMWGDTHDPETGFPIVSEQESE